MNTAGNEELRVVLDSNVFVSAFTHPEGPVFQIWRSAIRRHYQLVLSQAIVNEVGGVLRRKFGWDEKRVLNRLKFMTKVAELITPDITVREAIDEDDNRILECAVAGRADLIVSGDQHLRRLHEFRGIGIVHPADFIRIAKR